MRGGQWPHFLKTARPFLGVFNEAKDKNDFGLEDALDLMQALDEDLFPLLAIANRMDESELREAMPDELIDLFMATFAMNLDFFVRRLLPALVRALKEVTGLVTSLTGSGRTPFNSSSDPATH
jgi:hypothetical protein